MPGAEVGANQIASYHVKPATLGSSTSLAAAYHVMAARNLGTVHVCLMMVRHFTIFGIEGRYTRNRIAT